MKFLPLPDVLQACQQFGVVYQVSLAKSYALGKSLVLISHLLTGGHARSYTAHWTINHKNLFLYKSNTVAYLIESFLTLDHYFTESNQ